MRSVRVAVLLAALALACLPAGARGDGDPASDSLIFRDVFYPYSPVSRPAAATLDAVAKTARRAGFPIKVALIATPADLGTADYFFGKPQDYANFLIAEITFKAKPHLLVVMADGFGGQNLGDKVDSALAPVKIKASQSADGLANAAAVAVARIATAAGHPVPVPKVSGEPGGGSGGGGSTSPAVYVVPGVVLALAAAGAALRMRRRRSETGESAAAEAD
jgi:hypothetical protein